MPEIRLTLPAEVAAERPTDYVITVDEGTTVADVATAVGVASEVIAPDADPLEPLAVAGLVSGRKLWSASAAVDEPGQLRLEVVGGPLAGNCVPLALEQQVTIGRGAEASCVLDDQYLEPAHATVVARTSGTGALVLSVSLHGHAGAVVNGVVAEGNRFDAVPADVFQLGAHVFRLGIAPASDTELTNDVVGRRGFNRPSRILPRTEPPAVSLPGDRPAEQEQTPLPWLSAVVPVVMGVSMALLFGRVLMLMMAAASPLMVVGSFLTNRRLARRKGERTEADWRQEIKETEARIDALVREQRIQSWYDQPDMVVVRDIATKPLSRLWERRFDDPDALKVRVGVTQGDLHARFEGGGQKYRQEPHSAGVSPEPVSIRLGDGPVGVAGASASARRLARAAVASLATLRSPRDLQMVVLCEAKDAPAWDWVKWLPHVHDELPIAAALGNSEDSRRERLRELGAVLDLRRRAFAEGVSVGSHIVVVVDGARRYRQLPGMVDLLRHGHRHGIFIIAIDSHSSRLPEEVETVIDIDATDPAMGRVQSGAGFHPRVLLDGLSLTHAEELARGLCGLHHIVGIGDEGTMPRQVRFVDLLGIDLDNPEPVVEQWARTARQTYVVIGADADGEVAVDLATAGPHALVAGTTGSGKSEFLQTLIVALALANRPDALNFVLVDYKGGSAFADCARLPHTVGTVTNLDARETERALASLEAELKRRERVLKDVIDAKDVDVAWAKDPERAAAEGLARLVLVIDEFAELKAELPDFINGLVRIARVGRSLGVHLVLATQRPAGAITPEMQSNINLRVALRVTDQADSSDVIGSGEAALISTSTPGRGFLRAGASAGLTPFQTGRVAGVRPGAVVSTSATAAAAPLSWDLAGYRPRYPASQQRSTAPVNHDDTDLRAIVNVLIAAADRAGIARNKSPWLVPLPTLLTLDSFIGVQLDEWSMILGLEDVPSEQLQRPRMWNLIEDSHLLIGGGARSGRTTALRSLLLQLIQRRNPGDLHLYGLDYGNGALLPFAHAPHAGAVVSGLDAGRVSRVLGRLLTELTRRQGLLTEAGAGSIAEQRQSAAAADKLPMIVLAIDGWERISSTLTPDEMAEFRDKIMRILREGPATGMALLVTGDRGISADRIAGAINTQLILPLRDVADYRSAGIMIREMPEHLVPGRALFGAEGSEMQMVAPCADDSGEGQHRYAQSVVAAVADFWRTHSVDGPMPMRVDTLPNRITLTEAAALAAAPGQDPKKPVVMVGGDELSRLTAEFSAGQHFLVVGDRGSGKSVTVATIAAQLGKVSGALAIAPRGGRLEQAATALGMPVLTDINVADHPAIADASIVIIDDADQLKDSPLEAALLVNKARRCFVVATRPGPVGTSLSGPIAEAKKGARGIALQPASSLIGTQAFSSSIPKTFVGRGGPGEGALYQGGEYLGGRVPIWE